MALRLTTVAVGKLRPAYRALADEYLRRLDRYGRVDEAEVREAGKAPTALESLKQEGVRLRGRIPSGSYVVVLDREGKGWTSEGLGARLTRWRDEGRSVAFVIGGSHGLAEDLKREAAAHWCLGAMTLPHELARLIVYEQLYRAWTIIRGEPYHK